jgi:glycosyltransferase involved in cell wall biosynthesis
MSASARRLVLLGMMAKTPVPGVVWQTLHYLIGFRRLGFDPYYVETHARTPSMLMESESDDSSQRAAGFIEEVMRRFDMGDRWAYHALHDDGRCFGLSDTRLRDLYKEAELVINLHGGTKPHAELCAAERLVYLETDPVRLQIELHDGVQSSFEFLEPHSAFFTFAENLGRPGCELPVCERFPFRPTRQPVVQDLWAGRANGEPELITTVGNWQQGWRDVRFRGEDYRWSKDLEWMKFVDLPRRTGKRFELALSGYQPRHREYLEKHGWVVRDALAFGNDADAYRDYIAASRAEFTVAKDQNIRFRSGWFSDRSATYLAAGRPVITQDTGFDCSLPTGEGLFAVSDIEEAAAAVEAIEADYGHHKQAAADIAREYFDAERVLGQLLQDAGVSIGSPAPTVVPQPQRERRRVTKESSVLALIPHYRCEEWLHDCLQSLLDQTRPLDGIVVIDDASDDPPLDIVERYPDVTLLHAERNVGPYRLIQQVMEDTNYDAYLFQDADDWSAPDRLELLLEGAERTGAELIGTQEMRVFCDEPEAVPIEWPLDVNACFAERPTAFPLLHPTSLVSRDVVMAVGGFATGLRFGGDAEFLRRVHHIARVVNLPAHGYYRRIRQNSLTTAPATRIGSPVRKQIMEMTFERANRNAELVASGREPDLSPPRTAPPVGFTRLAGPELKPGKRRPAPAAATAEEGPPSPIFVVGADRSGVSALACALGQHRRIALSVDAGWIGELARMLQDGNLTGERFRAALGGAASGLAAGARRRWVDGSFEHTSSIPALKALFPEARFIHVFRDAESAVKAVVDPPLGSAGATGGTQIPERLRTRLDEREALERWLRAEKSCGEAERELGDDAMLTVTYARLVEDPESLIRDCLEFLGEAYSPDCLRPLRGLRARQEPERANANDPLWTEARAISRRERSRRTTRDALSELVPEHTTVLVVSRGDDALLRLDGRRLLHFPQVESGVWAGHHPSNSRSAIAQLEELREGGAEFLFFPCTSMWWLEHYDELARHLEASHETVLNDPDRGALFELRAPAPSSNGKSRPKRPHRIVMVTDHFPKFSETFFVAKFLGLRRRGWDVHVVANRSNREHWEFFPSLREDMGGMDRLHVTKDVEAKLVALEPDLIHFGYGTLARGRMDLGDAIGCKVVVSFRGYDINSFGVEDRRCYEDVWQSADVLHVVGQNIWERAQRRGCPSDRPHTVITDAVDTSLFRSPDRTYEPVGTAERPFRILSVGRIHWKKGHEFGLAAVRLLLDRGIQVRYRIIGEGDHREPTLFSIEDLGLADHVEMVGGQTAPDVRKCLRWADAFLHPSLTEAFGVSVIEAQAMGLPVVCSDAGGLPENIDDGVTGFVVPRRDAGALADRLARLASDPTLREQLGTSARRRAETHFDMEQQLDRFDALYRDLLDGDERRPRRDPRKEERLETLDLLRKELRALETRRELLEKEVRGREVVERVQEFAASSLPRYARVLVVSRGDDHLLDLVGRHASHFPQAGDGAYAGHHPADSDAAIDHLEELREGGAQYLVIPGTSLWWLEHYAHFHEHLKRSYRRIVHEPEAYAVFSLEETPVS